MTPLKIKVFLTIITLIRVLFTLLFIICFFAGLNLSAAHVFISQYIEVSSLDFGAAWGLAIGTSILCIYLLNEIELKSYPKVWPERFPYLK